jgi:hypothetical protein
MFRLFPPTLLFSLICTLIPNQNSWVQCADCYSPFLQNVSNLEDFDRELNSYVLGSYVESK